MSFMDPICGHPDPMCKSIGRETLQLFVLDRNTAPITNEAKTAVDFPFPSYNAVGFSW